MSYDFLMGANGGGRSGGDFMSYVKFKVTEGRMWRADRAQDATGKWVTGEEDITNTFSAVFDFENTETGWADYSNGVSEFFVPWGSDPGTASTPAHKRAVKLIVKLSKDCCGDDTEKRVRKFSANSQIVLQTIGPLRQQWEKESAEHPGMLPVVKLEQPRRVEFEVAGKKKQFWEPVWKIVSWAPRPVDMPVKASKPAGAPTAGPASTGNVPMQPPAQQQPAAAAADFG